MIKRTAGKALKKLAKGFKSVLVTGPRQSGKTTLVKFMFPQKPYVLLEEPDVRAFAENDPRGFLGQFPNGAILDEVHRVPDLLSYLQGILDAKKISGQYILTGSCNFRLMQSITQSLAGRVGIVELMPFAYNELLKADAAPLKIEELLFKGLFPTIYDQKLNASQWYNSYIMTYLERDVRQLINLKDLSAFHHFLVLCASNIGQLLNTVRIGSDCGVDHKTVKSWLSILETSYLVFRLQPHHKNFRKRVVKTPKLYFVDTGLAARLLEIENEKQLRTHPLRGTLFENWCITEFVKERLNRGLRSNVYFWRNHQGLEVDAVADHGTGLMPVEIKSGSTVSQDWVNGLKKWSDLAGKSAEKGWVVYGGDRTENRSNLTIIPWKEIAKLTRHI